VDLVASVTDGGAPLVAGTTGHWRVRVANAGSAASSGRVSLQLSAPQGASLSGAGWDCADSECTSGSAVPAGGSLPELEVAVPVPAVDTPSSLAVSVSLSNPSDAVTGNNSVHHQEAMVVRAGADLIADITPLAAPFRLGGQGQFHVVVHNFGGTTTSAPVTVDLWASNYLLAQSGSGDGWSCDGATRCSHSGGLPGGGALPPLVFTVAVDADAPPKVAASVTVTSAADSDRTNNTRFAAVTTEGHIDLISSVVPSTRPFVAGQDASYEVVVRNTGVLPSSGPVTVRLDAWRVLSGSGDGWTCSTVSARCTTSAVVPPDGALPRLTFSGTLPASWGGGTTNATVQVSNGSDGVTANDTAWVSVPVVRGSGPDLLAAVSSTREPFVAGEQGSVSVTVRNVGVAATTGQVVVRPSAWRTLSGSGDGWSCAPSGTCVSQAAVPAGGSLPPITYVAGVPSDPFAVWASVQVVTAGDVVTANDSASLSVPVVTSPSGADVVVTTTAGGEPFAAGKTGHWAVHVANVGTAPTSGTVTVQFWLPQGATVSGSGWSCADGQCSTNATVAGGDAFPSLDVAAPVPVTDPPSTLSLSATVTGGEDADTTNNNVSISAGVAPGPVDLVASVVDGGRPLVAGETGHWKVRVTNAGSVASSGVVTVRLNLPSGASVSGAGWSCADAECSDDAPVGAGESLPELEVAWAVPVVEPPANVSLSAWLLNNSDSDTSNNTAYITTGVAPPVDRLFGSARVLTLSAGSLDVASGGQTELGVQVNVTDPDATDATITLKLSAGLDYIQGSTKGTTNADPELSDDKRTATWRHVPITASRSVTLTVQVKVAATATGSLPTEAAVSFSGSPLTGTDKLTLQVAAHSLTAVSPTSAATGSTFTLRVTGRLLTESDTVAIRRDGVTIQGTDVRQAGATALDATFTLTDAAPGQWDVLVTAPNGSQAVLPQALTVVATKDLNLDVEVVAPTALRLNAPTNIQVVVTNNSNFDVGLVPVELSVPSGVTLRPMTDHTAEYMDAIATTLEQSTTNPISAAAADAMRAQDYSGDLVTEEDDTSNKVVMLAPRIDAGKSAVLTVQAVPTKQVTGSIDANVYQDPRALFAAGIWDKGYDPSDDLAKLIVDCPPQNAACQEEMGRAADVTRQYLSGFFSAFHVAADLAGFYDFGIDLSLRGFVRGVGALVLLATGHGIDVLEGIIELWKNAEAISKLSKTGKSVKDVQFGVTSRDPNQVLGPAGVGDPHWIADRGPLRYILEFENAADATAAAGFVRVTQRIDPSLDLSTLRFDSAAVGGRTTTLIGDGTRASGVIHSTYNGGTDIAVEATVDPATRTLTATFAGPDGLADPVTPTPYRDFLPPDVTPPEGEGLITYDIDPLPSLAHETVLKAKATIVFDEHYGGGSTLDTPEIFNTIDAKAPTAAVTALPATSAPSFKVSWSGDDGGSGVHSYDIYVSTDEGPWQPWLSATTDTSTTFAGEGGHTYRFFATARDAVGNQGALEFTAQASTKTEEPREETDRTPPSVELTAPDSRISLSKTLQPSWSGSDTESGVASYDVRWSRARYTGGFGRWVYRSSWQRTTATSKGLRAASGYDYCFSVRGRDKAGNVSAWTAPRCTAVPIDDRTLAASRGWIGKRGPGYFAGTFRTTKLYGATLTSRTARIQRIGLLATRCPECGTVGVYLNGALVGEVSLKSATTEPSALILLPSFSLRTGKVTIKTLSNDKTVSIDAIALSKDIPTVNPG
jgi:hypothetical protein